MADEEKKEDAKDIAALPTATIAERIGEYLYPEEKRFLMMFTNTEKKKFAIAGEVKILALLNRMCAVLMHQWHKAASDTEGLFIRPVMEATVSVSAEMRGNLMIQFDHDIGHILSTETAMDLAELMIKQIEAIESPEERAARIARKHPSAIVMPPKRIILP